MKLLIALAALLTLAPASAEIYKVVGANGRVSYTNVAPEDKSRPGTLLQPPAVRGAVLSSSLAPAASPEPELQVPVRRVSTRAPGRAPAADGSRILTPDVIGAVANVMGVAQLVSSSRDFCIAAMPASNKRYANAAQGWDHRNATVVAQKDRILSHPVQHMVADALSADMIRKTADMMQPIKSSDNAARVKWCDKAFADVDRGVLDLIGRPSIAPLMNYGRR